MIYKCFIANENYQSGTLKAFFSQLHALLVIHPVAILADQAFPIQPVITVLEIAAPLSVLFILSITLVASVSRVLQASIYLAGTSFQLVVG